MPLYAVRGQVEVLRTLLAAADPWRALVVAYPKLRDVVALHARWGLTAGDVEGRLTRLYHAYAREMEGYFASIPRPDWGGDAATNPAVGRRLAAIAERAKGKRFDGAG